MINYLLYTNAINSYLITYWLLIKCYSFLFNNSQIFPFRFQVSYIVYTVIAEALAWKNPYKNFSLNTCLKVMYGILSISICLLSKILFHIFSLAKSKFTKGRYSNSLFFPINLLQCAPCLLSNLIIETWMTHFPASKAFILLPSFHLPFSFLFFPQKSSVCAKKWKKKSQRRCLMFKPLEEIRNSGREDL